MASWYLRFWTNFSWVAPEGAHSFSIGFLSHHGSTARPLRGPRRWLMLCLPCVVAGAHVHSGRRELGWNYAPSPSCIKHGATTTLGWQGLGSCPPHPPLCLGLLLGLPPVCPAGSRGSRGAPGTGTARSHGPSPVPAVGADAALSTRGPAAAALQ